MKTAGLEVVEFLYRTKKQSYYLVRCKCGNEFKIRGDHLKTQSKCAECSFKSKIVDLSGRKFGRLSVVSFSRIEGGKTYFNCICDCGNQYEARNCALTSGNTKSCGCLNNEKRIERNTTHGLSKTDEYRAWVCMLTRCLNPNRNTSERYIHRGIKVCDRWLHSFENFLSDMGPRPSKKHSVDRINNDGDYEPGNCRWATMEQQANNTSKNLILNVNGKTFTAKQASRAYGVNYSTIINRIKYGWNDEKCVFTPTRCISPKLKKHV